MTIDDIIAAFRSVQTNTASSMRTEYPAYTPEGAQARIEFIEAFLTFVKRGDKYATEYLNNWSEESPDSWDDIMDGVLAYLGVNDTDEFWVVLNKGI